MNQQHQTPAWYLGLLPRALSFQAGMTWRQDWGELSIAPTSYTGGRTVARVMG